MSLTRFFHDPYYTIDDLNRFIYDPYGYRYVSQPNTPGQLSQNVVPKPFVPKLDLHEDDESNTVTATFELPGLTKDDIAIDAHNDLLVVSGETTSSSETNDERGYTIRERQSGKFSRALPLPRGTKPEDVRAKMENGILTVTFPKVHPESASAQVTVA